MEFNWTNKGFQWKAFLLIEFEERGIGTLDVSSLQFSLVALCYQSKFWQFLDCEPGAGFETTGADLPKDPGWAMIWNSSLVSFMIFCLLLPRVILSVEREPHIHKKEENCVFIRRLCDIDNCGNEGDRAIKLQAQRVSHKHQVKFLWVSDCLCLLTRLCLLNRLKCFFSSYQGG